MDGVNTEYSVLRGDEIHWYPNAKGVTVDGLDGSPDYERCNRDGTPIVKPEPVEQTDDRSRSATGWSALTTEGSTYWLVGGQERYCKALGTRFALKVSAHGRRVASVVFPLHRETTRSSRSRGS